MRGFAEAVPTIPRQTVEEVFRIADRDGNGRVGFGEFARIMTEGGEGTAGSFFAMGVGL